MGHKHHREHERERNRETIFGVNPVTEALKAGRRKFIRIIVKEGHRKGGPVQNVIEAAEQRHIKLDFVSMDEVARVAGAEGHQGIAAVVTPPPYVGLDELIKRCLASPLPTLAVLDSVMDPRNLGAIIRSAEAFGLSGVIFPSDRAAAYTPIAAKASAGAGERMNLCMVTNIAETIRRLRDEGFACVALEEDAPGDFTKAPDGPLAVVLGGEGTGVRPLVLKRCDYAAKIPMRGKIGSLNVSAAAAIGFYVAAQRG
ncbi:MAG: 23S rRNA (guanosine(2251)-2'-O)-methyltransferase RlmB [Nitrospinae bacterium]|nr:23S rRNA (guanosine(2251)-2'-O)-methyltransferase RlmB [Nitrospinota bacterium]